MKSESVGVIWVKVKKGISVVVSGEKFVKARERFVVVIDSTSVVKKPQLNHPQ